MVCLKITVRVFQIHFRIIELEQKKYMQYFYWNPVYFYYLNFHCRRCLVTVQTGLRLYCADRMKK